MAQIQVDRHVILPAGAPTSGIDVGPKDGLLVMTIVAEGVRVAVRLAPQEAINFGTGVILAGGEAARQAQAPAVPAVLRPNGAG